MRPAAAEISSSLSPRMTSSASSSRAQHLVSFTLDRVGGAPNRAPARFCPLFGGHPLAFVLAPDSGPAGAGARPPAREAARLGELSPVLGPPSRASDGSAIIIRRVRAIQRADAKGGGRDRCSRRKEGGARRFEKSFEHATVSPEMSRRRDNLAKTQQCHPEASTKEPGAALASSARHVIFVYHEFPRESPRCETTITR